jgi:transcriptional regulator with XRE-family HTH domain
MPISDNLKTLRDKRRLTQGELAKKAGIELAQISRIERGATQPKLDTIKKLALALECSSDELIFDEGEKTLSRRNKEIFEKIENLSHLKRNEILNVVNAYCTMDKINRYALLDEMDTGGVRNKIEAESEEDYEIYKEELKALEEREIEFLEQKNALKTEESEIIALKIQLLGDR